VLAELDEFAGKGKAHQDDITIVVLERAWRLPAE
jgi:hypothetical protein